MNGNQNEYIFCPYCGGVTRPGVCSNCGIVLNDGGQEKSSEAQNTTVVQANNSVNQNPGYQTQKENNASGQQNNMNAQPMQPTYRQPAQQAPAQRQPVQRQHQAQEPKKKSRWWIWLLVIGGILLLGVLLIAIIAVAAAVFVPMFLGTSTTGGAEDPTTVVTDTLPSGGQITVEESAYYDEQYYLDQIHVYERELGRLDFSDFDWDDYADSADYYNEESDGSNDPFLASNYSSTFGSNHDNHSLSEFSGEYYEPFVDCIDANQNYGLSRNFIEYSDEIDDVEVKAYIAYIQLEGGEIPNEDEINRKILEMTANDLFGHLSGQKPYPYDCDSVTYMVDSFIPYNDGEKMSILLDVNIVQDEEYFMESYIYAINIDLENGTIIENDSLLKTDEAFAAMFREKCCAQNGDDIDGLNAIDDATLSYLLSNESTNIVFFSPYGMEVGYSYEAMEGTSSSRGWVTITLKDYEQYLL